MRRSFVLSLACHALLALLLLAGAWVWPGRGLKAPPVLAEVELVEQNTPAVGQTAAAAALSAAPSAKPPAEPPAPPDLSPPPQRPAAPAAPLPLPPPPAPAAPPALASTRPAARPQPLPRPAPAPMVRLGNPGAAGTGLVSGSQVIPAAIDSAVHNIPPAYPALAVREGEQGSVILKVHIAADGSAAAVDIFRTSGYSLLDRAARGAVGQWHFVPARQAELPVPSTMLVKIRFVLTNSDGGQ
ncbi:MAG: energy transducer TonB [Acetobacteraceae bacterium]